MRETPTRQESPSQRNKRHLVFVQPCNCVPTSCGAWMERDSTKWGPAQFSRDGQRVNILGFVASVQTTQLRHCYAKAVIHKWCNYVPIKLY